MVVLVFRMIDESQVKRKLEKENLVSSVCLRLIAILLIIIKDIISNNKLRETKWGIGNSTLIKSFISLTTRPTSG